MDKGEKLQIYRYTILLITTIFISILHGCNPATYSIFPGPAESGGKGASLHGPADSSEKDVTLVVAGHNQPDTVVNIEQIDQDRLTDTGNKNRAEYKLAPGRHTVFYFFSRPGHASVISSPDLNISFTARSGHSYEFKNYTLWDNGSPEKTGATGAVDFLTMITDTTEGEVVAWDNRGRGDFKEEVQSKGLKLPEFTKKKAAKKDSLDPTLLSTGDRAVFLDFVNKGNEYGIHKAVFLDFVYKGNKYGIYFIVSRAVHEKLLSISRSLSHGKEKEINTKKDFILARLNNRMQREELLPLVEKIKSLTPDVYTQARIATSLVQNIPYKDVADYEKYPYGVLWEHGGACSEKSDLLLFLLRELGFGTATLLYKNENHRAVGIKCPDTYDIGGSGYCYVEATTPKIITDNKTGFAGVRALTDFTTIHISEGIQLEGVKEEFTDKNLYYGLINKSKAKNWLLEQNEYDLYNSILSKYGIE